MSSVVVRDSFKLALSLVLFYWLALTVDWDLPKYGALAIVLISLGTTGASLRKGIMRIGGTTGGLAVGLLLLALFAQDRWLLLACLAGYLVVVGCFMQASSYGYAWFVAGFLPPLIWATTYGEVEDAFHYAIFRYLETFSGIALFTLISVLLWPRSAGDILKQQGAGFWPVLRNLVGAYRGRLGGDTDGAVTEVAELRTKGAALGTQMFQTMTAALIDTPTVRAKRSAWERLRADVRALTDALELWQETIDDCRTLDPARLMPGLDDALDVVDRRLARIGVLWNAGFGGGDALDADDDEALLTPASPEIDRSLLTPLAHFDRAAILNFALQVKTLDEASRDLLGTMRVIADVVPARDLEDMRERVDVAQPSRWDRVSVLTALLPGLSFTVAFFFWILFDPPSGASTVSFAAIIALLPVMGPVNVLSLLMALLWVTVLVVGPIYFVVMPRLEGGVALLALVFVYAFGAGLLAKRAPLVKAAMLVMFVMMSGISNDQSYSFMGFVGGAQMIVLGAGIAAIVQMLLVPVQPKRMMVHALRRFFAACTQSIGGRPGDAERRSAVSHVVAAPRELEAIAKRLDDGGHPEHVRSLLNGLESIALRVRAMDVAAVRVAGWPTAWSESFVAADRELRAQVERIFDQWARFEHPDASDAEEAAHRFARSLERDLDAMLSDEGSDRVDDRLLIDVYAMLGCLRGLVRAIGDTQRAAGRINWGEWLEARF